MREGRRAVPCGVHNGSRSSCEVGAEFGSLLWQKLRSDRTSLPRKTVPRNSHLYTSGGVCSAVYLVRRGWVKSCVPTAVGKVSLIDLHTRGDVIGVPAGGSARHPDSAIAMSECSVEILGFDQLLLAIQRYGLLPAWTEFLLHRLCSQQEIISNFITLDSEQRLAARLLMITKRMARSEDAPVQLPSRLTHEEIAAMVGTTRSRVGQFLTNFERAGLIDRSDNTVTVVPARLRRFLETAA